MKNLPTNSKNNSTQKHNSPDVRKPSNTVNSLPNDTNNTGDNEHDSGPDFINHNTANEGYNDIGEGIEWVEEIELGLAEFGGTVDVIVFLDVLLEGLGRERSTEGVSKQYSQPKTTRQAIRRAT